MHELSIADHIVETLTRDLADLPEAVIAVQIDVGVLSGVVPDALQFAWEIACQDTRFAGSRLRIREIQAVAHCEHCKVDRIIPSIDRMRCPICDRLTPDLVAGKELQIRAVEMADPGAQAATSDTSR